MRVRRPVPTVGGVNSRTPVWVYASDPLSAAGARSQLMGQPSIELVGPADVGRARVAVVVADGVDDWAVRAVRAIRRDGIPRTVMVASHFGEEAVVAAVAAGVTSFLRRAEATSARLVDTIRDADRSGCRLPVGLLERAAAADGGPRAAGRSATPAPEPEPLLASGGSAQGVATLSLSARESEVLRLVADGYDTSDIAEMLAYSESTIKSVLTRIMGRLGAHNRCHAVAVAIRDGLIQ